MVKKGSTKLINRSTSSYFVLEYSINLDLIIFLAFITFWLHLAGKSAMSFLPEQIFKRMLTNNKKLTSSDLEANLAPMRVDIEKIAEAFKKNTGLQSQKKKNSGVDMEDIEGKLAMLEMAEKIGPILNKAMGGLAQAIPAQTQPVSPPQVPENITK